MTRGTDVAGNLAQVRHRVAAACAGVGRSPDEVTLVAVTKTHPVEDIRLLAELGISDIGENRDQEAREKHRALTDLPVRWHFVGQLQRNKCRSVATYADVVHSVDRMSLVAALSDAAARARRTVTALVQVDLSDPPDPARGGVPVDLVPDLAEAVGLAPGLALGGLMAVAPLGVDPDVAFHRLALVAANLRAAHPDATVVSAGMSGDLEAAIRHGATHVRVGTALLGPRAAPVG